MADVIPFAKRAEPPADPHLSGEAVCLSCAHDWVAVVPAGSAVNNPDDRLSMECPKCHSFKGVMRKFTQYVDVPSWHCAKCGGFLFSVILAKGDVPTLCCACCGELINGLDLWNRP